MCVYGKRKQKKSCRSGKVAAKSVLRVCVRSRLAIEGRRGPFVVVGSPCVSACEVRRGNPALPSYLCRNILIIAHQLLEDHRLEPGGSIAHYRAACHQHTNNLHVRPATYLAEIAATLDGVSSRRDGATRYEKRLSLLVRPTWKEINNYNRV